MNVITNRNPNTSLSRRGRVEDKTRIYVRMVVYDQGVVEEFFRIDLRAVRRIRRFKSVIKI